MAFIELGQWEIHDESGRRKYLNAAELQRFLKEADRCDPPTRALCYVLAYSGCRITEALRLTAEQLDTERIALRFRTLKRRRIAFRLVPIPVPVATMLLALPLLPGARFWTMHRSTAWRRVHRAMVHAGILGPMATCKGLRHGFAITCALETVPGPVIRRWMGHASLNTTAVYLDAIGIEERTFARRVWESMPVMDHPL